MTNTLATEGGPSHASIRSEYEDELIAPPPPFDTRVAEQPHTIAAHVRTNLPLSVVVPPPLPGATTEGDIAPAVPDGGNADTDRGVDDEPAPQPERTDDAAAFSEPRDESDDSDESDADDGQTGSAVPQPNDEHTAI